MWAIVPFSILATLARIAGMDHIVMFGDGARHNSIFARGLKEDMLPRVAGSLGAESYSVANIFPLYPVLELIASLPFTIAWKGPWSLNMVLTSVNNLLFYKLCCVVGLASPLLMTAIYTFFSARTIYLRFVGNELNLVEILLSAVFITKRRHQCFLMALSIALLIITSEIGIVVALFLILELLRTAKTKEIVASLSGAVLGIALLIGFQDMFLGLPTAYFDEVFKERRRYPFAQLIADAQSISTLRLFHGVYGFYAIPLICGLALTKTHRDIAIPLIMALIWSSSRLGSSAFDAGAPMATFLVILGGQKVLASSTFKKAIYIIAPVYLIAIFYLAYQHLT